MHDGLTALVAVHPRHVECALAAIGLGDDGYLSVGSCFADTGGETPLREPSNVSGAMTMRTAFPSRAEFIRIPLDDLIYQSYISHEPP